MQGQVGRLGRLGRRCRGRQGDERGAAAVVMGIGLTLVLLVIAAFAVDLGMQRTARRDMQAVADVVALDLARQLDGRTVAELTSVMNAEMPKSVARNSGMVGSDPEMAWQLGEMKPSGFEAMSGDEVPSAVEVTAGTTVSFAFGRVIGFNSGDANRAAVAQSQEQGCMRVGTMVLSLATNDSALNGLLGDALDTTVIGYDGLVGATVSVADIKAQINAASPDDVVLADVTMADFVVAAAQVLSNTPGSEAQADILEAITAQADLGPITVGDVLGIEPDGDAALGADLDVFEMITGSAFLANGENAIAVPGLNLNLAGLTNLTTKLYVTERPRQGCLPGPGTAQTSQVRLEIGGDLINLRVPLVAEITGKIKITVSLADALARLRKVTCTDGEPTSMRISVTDQNLARTEIDLSEVRAKALLGLINVPLIGLRTGTSQPAVEGTYDLALPTYYWRNPYKTPQSPTSLPNVTSTDLSVLGLNLGSILNPVLNTLLNPLLQRINTTLIPTLAQALGLRIAGVDLFAVRTPTCSGPKLVG